MKKILPPRQKQLAWLHALSTSLQHPKIDQSTLGQYSQEYLDNYLKPWANIDTDNDFPVPGEAAQLGLSNIDHFSIYLQELFDKHICQTYWAYNRQKIRQEFWDLLMQEVDIHSFPNAIYNAVMVVSADVRMMPTDLPIYPTEESYTIDHFQISQINYNTPVKVMHCSQSRRWAFIVSGHLFGWVKMSQLAKVKTCDQSIWLAATDWRIMIEDDYDVKEKKEWLFRTRIGQIFPKSPKGIACVTRMMSGYAKIIYCQIPDAYHHPFPYVMNHDNWFNLIRKLLAKPYGWGDIYGMRDCSRLIVDLWSCFGIWLPRLSGDQARLSTVITIPPKVDNRLSWIRDNGHPGETILYMPGHVVLYMGEVDNEPIIFQSIWGPKNSGYWIGESALMSLSFDKSLGEHYTTFLDRITRVILVSNHK